MKFSSITLALSLAPCVSAFMPSRVVVSTPAFTSVGSSSKQRYINKYDRTKREDRVSANVFLDSNESNMDTKKPFPSKSPVATVDEPTPTKKEQVAVAEVEAEAKEKPAEQQLEKEEGDSAPAIPENADITYEEVQALFQKWNDALATGDSSTVAKCYTDSPVLLPTVSDTPRTDFDSVKNYFDSFLLKQPQGKIIEGFINIGEGWASDTGIYEFTMGATGDVVRARYSFLYVRDEADGEYKIQHHHSSVMPEGIKGPEQITEDEVRDLFHLWNDALATLEPKNVADRYAKKSVLLPTVSDVPRTDYDSIQDYFVNFLKLEPQGEILESNVSIGFNWAQDCGIYEFTMGATGKKVKGRYSFIYIYEDGEWKISHHHSSVMPEGIITAEPITEEEVRGLFNLWNDALASKDPFKVAARYSKKGVLLPTVSNTPRTDGRGIIDYFTNFLKLEPQGEILGSEVVIGTNWARDAGAYEFTMGATGDVVQGYYTFVYVYEDGEWKISQHHSSKRPDAVLI